MLTLMIDFIYQEQFLQSLINKPFKIPIPNYQQSGLSRALGTRRQGARQSLHSPDDENALILYSPPVLSATELTKADQYECSIFYILSN
jgi:DNA repair and recombination protein RAD54 and RAD54-like protein